MNQPESISEWIDEAIEKLQTVTNPDTPPKMTNITTKHADALLRATKKHGPLTPEEFSIFLDGINEGRDMKADEVAPRMAQLEIAIRNHGILFPS